LGVRVVLTLTGNNPHTAIAIEIDKQIQNKILSIKQELQTRKLSATEARVAVWSGKPDENRIKVASNPTIKPNLVLILSILLFTSVTDLFKYS
jgi:hypothetical protein